MNERIRELAEQCISIPNHLNPPVFDQEKFAELIVRECADIANKNRTAMEMDRNTHLTADAIKQHFGVEE
jgi:hypothetical protein